MRLKSTGQMAHIANLTPRHEATPLTPDTVVPPAVGLAMAMGTTLKAYCAGNWMLQPMKAKAPQVTYRRRKQIEIDLDFTEYLRALQEQQELIEWFDGSGWNPLMDAYAPPDRNTLHLASRAHSNYATH